MTTAPTWLLAALEQCESRALDSEQDREAVAEAIAAAFPRDELVASLRDTTADVLRLRGIADSDGCAAREVARNAAQVAEFVLELPAPRTKAGKYTIHTRPETQQGQRGHVWQVRDATGAVVRSGWGLGHARFAREDAQRAITAIEQNQAVAA